MKAFKSESSCQRFDPSSIQLPPDEPYVGLSHALSWIAFQRSMPGPRLSIEIGLGLDRDLSLAGKYAESDRLLLIAVRSLTDLGTAGAIEIRGRFFRDVLDDEINILTERIPLLRLADYRWFDMLDDCLHRGLGLAWDHKGDACYPRDNRHFRFVTVNRTELLREFPPVSKVPMRSTHATERKCQQWLLSGFKLDPDNRKSKQTFKREALKEFRANLSGRGFDRAWAAVAEGAGRHRSGAKPKR